MVSSTAQSRRSRPRKSQSWILWRYVRTIRMPKKMDRGRLPSQETLKRKHQTLPKKLQFLQEKRSNPTGGRTQSPKRISKEDSFFWLRSFRSLVYVHARARGREKERGIQRREGGEVVGEKRTRRKPARRRQRRWRARERRCLSGCPGPLERLRNRASHVKPSKQYGPLTELGKLFVNHNFYPLFLFYMKQCY